MFGPGTGVAGYRPTKMAQHLLLCGALLGGRAGVCAAEQPGMVPGAHGRVMMLYLSQPIGSRGASRIYGLRLQQPTPMQAAGVTTVMSHQRDLIDLQVRRYSISGSNLDSGSPGMSAAANLARP